MFNINENRFYLFIRIVLSIAIASIIYSLPFHGLEFQSYDARFRLSPASKTAGLIETVAIDRKTIETLKRDPNITDHNNLLKNIITDEPAMVVYLLSPQTIVGDLNQKKLFTEQASTVKDFLVLYDGFPFKGEEKKSLLPAPFTQLKTLPGILSADTDNFAADGVTRRAILAYEGQLFLQPYIAEKFNHISKAEDYRGQFIFRDTNQVLVDHKPPGTFPKTSFYDVIENRFPSGQFKNKIVLIGVDSQADTNDYFKSVYSRDNIAISKLEVHANVIDTLIQNTGIVRSHPWVDFAFTILVSLFAVFVVFNFKPLEGILASVIVLFSFCFISWILFFAFRYSLSMAHPLLALFICYYFFIPYRLIGENRKSWEYQQKNRLLMQVEELKTNFLGMMSHDLKTPLARIHGMADIAMAHDGNLLPTQKNALQTISQSAEELTDFISSILDLSRVESQNIKLNLESKDINEILKQVITKHEYLAHAKNIKIITEFDPLFSVRLDVQLMKQVFSNLIENAIKYSPEDSKILVSTEEIGDKIIVQVADQGIGIPRDELPNIFMKFYRSGDAKSSTVKGSGLGLYLAKYFVDLHNGNISVESQPKQGSTFTVDLPMS